MGGKTEKRPEKIARARSFTNGLMKTYQLIEISGSGKECIVKRINAETKLPLCAGRSDQADIIFGQEDKQVSRQQFSITRKGSSLAVQNVGSLPVFFGEKNKSLLPQSSITVSEAETFHFAGCSLRVEEIQADKKYVVCLEYDDGHKDKIPLPEGRMTLGRGENNSVVVKTEGVSRDHVSLESLGGGAFRLVDENSKNGVYIYKEGAETRISDPVEIRAGERFAFGRVAGRVQEEIPVADKKKFIGIVIGLSVAVLVAVSATQMKNHVAAGPTVPFDKQFADAWNVSPEENKIQALDALRNVETIRADGKHLEAVTNSVDFLKNQQALGGLLKEKGNQRIKLQEAVSADPWAFDSYTKTDTSPTELIEAITNCTEAYERLKGQDIPKLARSEYQDLSAKAKELCLNLGEIEVKKEAILGELKRWKQNPSIFLKTKPDWWGDQIGALLSDDKAKTAIDQFKVAQDEVLRRQAQLTRLAGNVKDNEAYDDLPAPERIVAYPPALLRQIDGVMPAGAIEVFKNALAARPTKGDLSSYLVWAKKLKRDASNYATIQQVLDGVRLCDEIIAKAQEGLCQQTEVSLAEIRLALSSLDDEPDYSVVSNAMDAISKHGLAGQRGSDSDLLLRDASISVLQRIRKICKGWYDEAYYISDEAKKQVLKKQLAAISAEALRYCKSRSDIDARYRADFQAMSNFSAK